MLGHHVQVDVKFLSFTDDKGKKIKYYQYTAIDGATRTRALKIYEKHNQVNAIDFINYVINKFPFRIHTIQTDNGKVEKSHKTAKREFYQLITYQDDIA